MRSASRPLQHYEPPTHTHTHTHVRAGASVCEECPRDTFAPWPGSPKCIACGRHTHSAPGSIGCSQDCVLDLAEAGATGQGSQGMGGKLDLPGGPTSEYAHSGGNTEGEGLIDLGPLRQELQALGPIMVHSGDTGVGGLGARRHRFSKVHSIVKSTLYCDFT